MSQLTESTTTVDDDCRYCTMISNEDQMKKNAIVRDDEVFVIENDSSHAPHHYLVIANKHIRQFADISKQHIQLVEHMKLVGCNILRKRLKVNGEPDMMEPRLRCGFQCSLFGANVSHSNDHLHMHIIYPIDQMSIFYRTLVFRPGKMFFKSCDQLIEDLDSSKSINEIEQEVNKLI